MHISEPNPTNKVIPLLLLGFRPFFLGGSIFGTLAMLLWLLTAVHTWTGLPSIKGNKLLCLVGVWALGRIFYYL
jgi:uncharacterized protein involved in response to NO